MRPAALTILLAFAFQYSASCQTSLGTGEQPQIAIDPEGIVRLVYGEDEKILYAESRDNGATFSRPILVSEIPGMHLGMSRGPQIATSKDYSLVTAIDKQGNIHSFILDHKTGKWRRAGRVNDQEGSAPEGLMSVAADDNNRFYAVWLDLRHNHKNNICFASFKSGKWSPNKFAYVSADDHVCECCRPSVTARGGHVAIMFRNWLNGSRDLYLTTSTDGGRTFSPAQKLGNGTWPLKGCPMDGGGIAIDAGSQIHTAWQRDGIVYTAQPGEPEQRIGEGRHVSVNGNLITWENGSDLFLKGFREATRKIGEGAAPEALQLRDNSILAVWEKDSHIIFRKMNGSKS